MTGTMPKWRQYLHTFAAGFMCMLFAGLALIGARILFGPTRPPGGAPVLFSVLFIAFAIVAIGGQIWYRRRIVSEFAYDGYLLQYRTIGVPELQTAPLQEITAVRAWRGRSGPMGYRIVFRDGRKVYLEYSVTNAAAMAAELASRINSQP